MSRLKQSRRGQRQLEKALFERPKQAPIKIEKPPPLCSRCKDNPPRRPWKCGACGVNYGRRGLAPIAAPEQEIS